MLHPLLIDAESLEGQIPAGSIVRLHGSRQEERTLHVQILHAILHHRQFHRDDAGHLDCAAERYLPVTLREVEVADAELGPGDVDREEDFAAPAQVLDVAVAAMLWAAGYGPCALFAYFLFQLARCGARVDILRLRWLSDDALEFGCANEMGFATVPLGENFGGGSTAEDARMDEAGEPQMRDMAGGAEDALEVPDCFSAGMNSGVSGWARQDRSWSCRPTRWGRSRQGSLPRCLCRTRL